MRRRGSRIARIAWLALGGFCLFRCGSTADVESEEGDGSLDGVEEEGNSDESLEGSEEDAIPDDSTVLPWEDRAVLFVHGINGSAADWDPMIARFEADGWPRERLVAHTFPDPAWGCNATNAELIGGWLEELRGATGATRVSLVAHSMGGLSSRYFVRNLGGSAWVDTFVTLGTMHHGLRSSCLSPLPVCVWQELCATGAFMTDLNTPPVTPGPTRWASIYSESDGTVPAAPRHNSTAPRTSSSRGSLTRVPRDSRRRRSSTATFCVS
jgi:pimeloyl-ACP methyl ester carboxylesterase